MLIQDLITLIRTVFMETGMSVVGMTRRRFGLFVRCARWDFKGICKIAPNVMLIIQLRDGGEEPAESVNCVVGVICEAWNGTLESVMRRVPVILVLRNTIRGDKRI